MTECRRQKSACPFYRFLHLAHRRGWLAFGIDGGIAEILAEYLAVFLQNQFHAHVSVFAVRCERSRHRYRTAELNGIRLREHIRERKCTRCSQSGQLEKVATIDHVQISKKGWFIQNLHLG